MALEWRPAHFSAGFHGYDGGRFVAQVVRYSDIDHEHGHAVRGQFWAGFLNGPDAPKVPGRHPTPEAAMAALEDVAPEPARHP